MVANCLVAVGLGITFYYVFDNLPPIDSVPKFATFSQLPLFFGTAIFALEGIGVVSILNHLIIRIRIKVLLAWNKKALKN